MAVCARDQGIPNLIVPAENAAEAAVVEGVHVLRRAASGGSGGAAYTPAADSRPARRRHGTGARRTRRAPDFRDVRGQTMAKRALEVAAAGAHNVLMIGPPGSGKTHAGQAAGGHSAAADVRGSHRDHQDSQHRRHCCAAGCGLLHERPFRAPHHTISDAGLIGGGTGTPRPGEVSLAHNGVLFLDEFPEFPRDVLEMLRQPLEDGVGDHRARQHDAVLSRASFMLIAAMNPCQCGFYGRFHARMPLHAGA